MKYLKLFESDELYTKINSSEYAEKIRNSESYFNSEVSNISEFIKALNSKFNLKLNSGISFDGKSGGKITSSVTISYTNESPLNTFLLGRIDKGEDSWFYIQQFETSFNWDYYYKCDDLIGVYSCIENIVKNKFKK